MLEQLLFSVESGLKDLGRRLLEPSSREQLLDEIDVLRLQLQRRSAELTASQCELAGVETPSARQPSVAALLHSHIETVLRQGQLGASLVRCAGAGPTSPDRCLPIKKPVLVWSKRAGACNFSFASSNGASTDFWNNSPPRDSIVELMPALLCSSSLCVLRRGRHAPLPRTAGAGGLRGGGPIVLAADRTRPQSPFVSAPPFAVRRRRTMPLVFAPDEEREMPAGAPSSAKCSTMWRISRRVFRSYTLISQASRPGGCLPETGKVLAELAKRGHVLGIASNFDHRLRGLVEEFAGSATHAISCHQFRNRLAQASPEFFAEMCRQVGSSPEQVLYVGDDPINDYEGARAARVRAVLLDPRRPIEVPSESCITSLSDLLQRAAGSRRT